MSKFDPYFEYRLNRKKLDAEGVNYRERLDREVRFENWILRRLDRNQIVIDLRDKEAAAIAWVSFQNYRHRPEYYSQFPILCDSWRSWESRFEVEPGGAARRKTSEDTETGHSRERFFFMAHAPYPTSEKLGALLKKKLRPLVNGPMLFQTCPDSRSVIDFGQLLKDHPGYEVWAVTSADPQIRDKVDQAFVEVASFFDQPLRHF